MRWCWTSGARTGRVSTCARLTREQGAPAVLLVSGNGPADGAVGKACGACDLISKADLAYVDLRSIWA
jgi:hypothetical protein